MTPKEISHNQIYFITAYKCILYYVTSYVAVPAGFKSIKTRWDSVPSDTIL